jgi:Uncharacterized conserved protein
MKSWRDIGFKIEITADQSITLQLLKPTYPDSEKGESMHHSGGAMAETDLIYGTPIRDAFNKLESPSFLIMGLGLGYIEMVIAREALLKNLEAEAVGKIQSFESVPELREFFFAWLWDQKEILHDEVFETYDKVLEFVILGTAITKEKLKMFLRHHFPSVNSIGGAFNANDKVTGSYSGILYDAFSSKTTPHLWDEDFLISFLLCARQDSFFSTYACKAAMRNALKASGFEVIVRPAFVGKRTSTLALRGQLAQS